MLGGKAILDGQDITGLSTQKVLAAGVNYVPEDRHLHGLFKISDVAANTTSAILGRKEMGRFFLNGKREREVTQKYVDDFRTKVTGQDQLVAAFRAATSRRLSLAVRFPQSRSSSFWTSRRAALTQRRAAMCTASFRTCATRAWPCC